MISRTTLTRSIHVLSFLLCLAAWQYAQAQQAAPSTDNSRCEPCRLAGPNYLTDDVQYFAPPVEQGVPLLSRVPGLKRLFKNVGVAREGNVVPASAPCTAEAQCTADGCGCEEKPKQEEIILQAPGDPANVVRFGIRVHELPFCPAHASEHAVPCTTSCPHASGCPAGGDAICPGCPGTRPYRTAEAPSAERAFAQMLMEATDRDNVTEAIAQLALEGLARRTSEAAREEQVDLIEELRAALIEATVQNAALEARVETQSQKAEWIKSLMQAHQENTKLKAELAVVAAKAEMTRSFLERQQKSVLHLAKLRGQQQPHQWKAGIAVKQAKDEIQKLKARIAELESQILSSNAKTAKQATGKLPAR